MRFTTGRSAPAESPVSCSYSPNTYKNRNRAANHGFSRRSSRRARQPSGAGFSVCAQQEAARETKKPTKDGRPSEIAGRPIADNTPYEMPVVWHLWASLETFIFTLSLVRSQTLKWAQLCALQPMDYEQTLQKAFTVAGIGLHSGEFGMCSSLSISICHAQGLALDVVSPAPLNHSVQHVLLSPAEALILWVHLRSYCTCPASIFWRREVLCARAGR